MSASTRRALLAFSVVSLGVPASADAAASRVYAGPGPLPVEVKSFDASTDVVVPTSGGAAPLIVASHGWSASGANQLGWAKHFASYGFVVAVPTFPSSTNPNTAVNAGIIQDLVVKLTGASASTYAVSPGLFGLEGHSAGGLATTVAAAKLAPAATVLFEPVDKAGEGKAAYAKLCQPVLAIFAESSACNQNAEWLGFESATTADLIAFKVTGSTHCDGENAKRTLCGPFCGGGADPDRQATYAHYTTAFFLSKLKSDAAATAALADSVVAQDSDLGGAKHAAGTCTPPSGGSDAGAKADAAGSAPGSTEPPPGSSPSGAPGTSKGAGDSPASSSTSAPENAGGCGLASSSHAATRARSCGGAALLALFALASFRRRRRR